MRRHLSNILKDERGATSIEYALLGVLVSASIIVGASTVGASVSNAFQNVADVFAAAPGNDDDNGNNGNNGNGKDNGKGKGKGKGK